MGTRHQTCRLTPPARAASREYRVRKSPAVTLHGMSKSPATSGPAGRRQQPKSYADAQAWVRRRLRTQPASTILNWITAQDRAAAQAMRESGVNPKTPEDRAKRENARNRRRWLRKLERALMEATKPRRHQKDLWQRTRPGAWGMEAQVYAANQTHAPDEDKNAA